MYIEGVYVYRCSGSMYIGVVVVVNIASIQVWSI
jgi:hypothetical protein